MEKTNVSQIINGLMETLCCMLIASGILYAVFKIMGPAHTWAFIVMPVVFVSFLALVARIRFVLLWLVCFAGGLVISLGAYDAAQSFVYMCLRFFTWWIGMRMPDGYEFGAGAALAALWLTAFAVTFTLWLFMKVFRNVILLAFLCALPIVIVSTYVIGGHYVSILLIAAGVIILAARPIKDPAKARKTRPEKTLKEIPTGPPTKAAFSFSAAQTMMMALPVVLVCVFFGALTANADAGALRNTRLSNKLIDIFDELKYTFQYITTGDYGVLWVGGNPSYAARLGGPNEFTGSTLVLSVTTDTPALMKGATYDYYSGHGWTSTLDAAPAPGAPGPGGFTGYAGWSVGALPQPGSGGTLSPFVLSAQAQVTMHYPIDRLVYCYGLINQFSSGEGVVPAVQPDSSLLADQTLKDGFRYAFSSLILDRERPGFAETVNSLQIPAQPPPYRLRQNAYGRRGGTSGQYGSYYRGRGAAAIQSADSNYSYYRQDAPPIQLDDAVWDYRPSDTSFEALSGVLSSDLSVAVFKSAAAAQSADSNYIYRDTQPAQLSTSDTNSAPPEISFGRLSGIPPQASSDTAPDTPPDNTPSRSDYTRYTRLPFNRSSYSDLMSVWAMANEITAGKAGKYDKALALESWLRANTTYTLEPDTPPAGRDFVAYFLETRRGYCVYNATAMAVMARMIGIPSRYVTGYGLVADGPGRYKATTGTAHAWAELYFDGVGWVTFDPTGGSANYVNIAAQTDAPAPADGAGPDQDAVSSITSLDKADTANTAAPGQGQSAAGGAPAGKFRLIAAVLVIALVLSAAAVFLFAIRPRRRARNSLSADSEALERLFRDIRAAIAALGYRQLESETILLYAGRVTSGLKLEGGGLNKTAADICALRYGGRAPSPEALRSAADLRGQLDGISRERLGKVKYRLNKILNNQVVRQWANPSYWLKNPR